MTDAQITQLKGALVTTAGGYLRNPGGPGTCTRCCTPTNRGPLCPDCRYASSAPGVCPDLLGIMTYAGYLDPIMQSGHVMRGYKNPAISPGGHRRTVALLAALALVGHRECPGRLLGASVSAWATVPSLPPKPHSGEHPLHQIVRGLSRPGAHEVKLTASSDVQNPRAVNGAHFSITGNDANEHHVLLIDDTWTSGGHATSAALSLKAAGATHVSVLVLARWLSVGWEATTHEWARARLAGPDFQPDVCPWTRAACP